MKPRLFNLTFGVFAFLISIGATNAQEKPSTHAVAASPPYRAVVLTDIGGSDPDDHQSMVHLLVYADTLDIEGLIATRASRVGEILKVIGLYEHDYPNLKNVF